jgi:hypothetical protein
MKTISSVLLLVVMLATFNCAKKDSAQSPTQNQKTIPPYVAGEVIATFTDTVSQLHAEGFLQAHALTTYTLYNFDQSSSHIGIIKVVVGQESSWIDTLQKYPEIKSAGLNYIYTTN